MEFDQPAYDRESGKAEYILDELKTQIQVGKLTEQAKLPSERDLSQKYRVSRMTARRALQMLEGEGFVTRHPVRGTFVGGIRERLHEQHRIAAEELRRSGSFLKDMEFRGFRPELYWLEEPSLVSATDDVAEHLTIPEDTKVLKRYRVQLADGLPYRIQESYYPADLFGELLTTDIGDKPLFDWLKERHGLSAIKAKEELTARLATVEERYHLQISPNAPVVDLYRIVLADSGRPIEWAHIVAVAALYTFTYEYDIKRG